MIPTADELLERLRESPLNWFTVFAGVYTEQWCTKGPTGTEILEKAGKMDEARRIVREFKIKRESEDQQ